MWTFLSSNFHFIISYRWLMKCLQYKIATSSTYKIKVSNSKLVILFHIHHSPSFARKTIYQRYVTLQTLENCVWSSMWLWKMLLWGGEGTNDCCYKYLHTHTQFTHQQSNIWRHLKYINTQNPPKCTFITWYEWSWPSIKLHHCTVEKTFEIPYRQRHHIRKQWWFEIQCTIMNDFHISKDFGS
jgi:hypothetical protein